MIRFNGQTQQVMGDNTDPRLEKIIKHHPKFPLAFWSFCNRKDGIDAFAINQPPITEIVGLHDVTLDAVEISDERSYLHVYDDAYVNKLDMSNGELHIMHGGYVGHLGVKGPAVVHISGHVGYMDINASAQVFLYDGAYVDYLHIYGEAFLQINKGAKIYAYDAPDPKSHVMLEDKESINKITAGADKIAYFSQLPAKPSLVKVRLRFNNYDELVEFCKSATEEYETYGRLKFGNSWISELHHKTVYDSCNYGSKGIDTVEFYADVASDIANTLIPNMRKALLAVYPGLASNIQIWWRGESELTAVKLPVDNYHPYESMVTERTIDNDLYEAMQKATPEQWNRLLKAVFGDDTTAEGLPHRTHDRGDE